MNSVDMAHNLIFSAKNINESTVTTNVPENFKFNGVVPFDMSMNNGQIEATVYGIDFDEAVDTFDKWLGTCK